MNVSRARLKASIKQIRRLLILVGPEVQKIYGLSALVGLIFFFSEIAFPVVMQYFTYCLEILPAEQFRLSAYLPKSLTLSILALAGYGTLRAASFMLRGACTGWSLLRFIRIYRLRIADYAVHFIHQEQLAEVLGLFSDRTNVACSAIQGIPGIVLNLVSVAFFLSFSLWLAPREFLVCMLGLILVIKPLQWPDRAMSQTSQRSLDSWKIVNETLVNSLKNQFLLRVYKLQSVQLKKIEGGLRENERVISRFYLFSAMKSSLPILFGILIISATAWISFNYFQTKPVVLISFFYVFLRFAQSSSELVTGLNEFKLQESTLTYIYRWDLKMKRGLRRIQTVESESLVHLQKPAIHKLSVENITFRWSKDLAPLFENLNFHLEKGQCLGIKGESGSGKSSLIGLILGIQKPQSGQIRWDGQEVSVLDPSFFNSVAYIGPEPFILAGTLTENLVFGLHQGIEQSVPKFVQALRLAQLDFLAEELEKGKDPEIHESSNLSTGQRQRLSLARALVRDASVYILDEATANLDFETESQIVELFEKIKKSALVIVVTHRSSFDRIFDQTLELKNGAWQVSRSNA